MFVRGLFLCALAILQCKGERITVALNEDSSFCSSVSSVVIDTDQRLVIIDLHPKRPCDSPTFSVRLSGTALYLLKLERQNYEPLQPGDGARILAPRKHTYFYSYPPIQDNGVYFLEVVVLLCAQFRPDNLIDNCVADNWRGRNVITAANSTITLKASLSFIATPRWVLGSGATLASLPTRIQSRTCVAVPPGPGVQALCELRRNPAELWQYQQYNWAGNVDWKDAYRVIGAPAVTVCFVGASHSRYLSGFAKEMDIHDTKVQFQHVETHYPEEFAMSSLVSHRCDYAVIGYGQWPASWVPKVPYSIERFKLAMKNVMTIVKEAAVTGANPKVFVRSINYNGLATSMTACPPTDHRIPPVIDAMNDVLAELAVAVGVPYIDTNHIMGPMWDSALDYCHPSKAVFTAEAEWILHAMFSSVSPVAVPVTTAPDITAPIAAGPVAPASVGEGAAVTAGSILPTTVSGISAPAEGSQAGAFGFGR
jgi:hypothetical protein